MQRSPTASADWEQRETSKSLQLSALFTTMLESNALLREEIDQMEGHTEHAMQHREERADGREQKQLERSVVVQSGQLHSQSLPARLLEDSVLSQQPAEQFTNLHSSLLAAEKKEDIAHTGCLGSQSESESDKEGTDEAWESEEQNKHSDSDSSVSTNKLNNQYCNQGECHHAPPPPLSLTSVSSTEISSIDHGENDPFASPGESMIDTMWDTFSVEDYASPLRQKEKRVKVCSRREPVQQAWSPQITIPEPFAMTVREEGKPKTKSRMLILAEQEKLEKQLQEEMECQKRFRALPVPATTYVPLDELRREEHEQLGCDRVVQVHSIKPFSFMKREQEKKQQKYDALKQTKCSERTVFRAKPIPRNILSPRISEELREKEEYRRILIRVRSQEMLARAELPNNMQVRHAVRKQRRERLENRHSGAFVTKEHTFHPNIKPDIPDHKQLYFQFQQQMAVRKEVKAPTTPKPFLLRTSSTPSRKVHLQEGEKEMEHSMPSSHTLSPSRSTCSGNTGVSVEVPHSRSHACRPMYSVQMTEAAKLRKSVSERKLAQGTEKEFEEEKGRRRKKEQLRELQSKVLQQVQSHDHSAWLQEKQKEKLQELRYSTALLLVLYRHPSNPSIAVCMQDLCLAITIGMQGEAASPHGKVYLLPQFDFILYSGIYLHLCL